MRSLVFVAGPSGSGKSRLSRLVGQAAAKVSLDDFYYDHDHPGMPRTLGITDWDHIGSWDQALALSTLTRLLGEGTARVPVYDISRSLRVGERQLNATAARLVIAEGIFAPETYRAAVAAGLPARAIWLHRPRGTNFVRRLSRDLREGRKAPAILVRRGITLYRREPQLRRHALECGFTPMGMKQAQITLEGLLSAS